MFYVVTAAAGLSQEPARVPLDVTRRRHSARRQRGMGPAPETPAPASAICVSRVRSIQSLARAVRRRRRLCTPPAARDRTIKSAHIRWVAAQNFTRSPSGGPVGEDMQRLRAGAALALCGNPGCLLPHSLDAAAVHSARAGNRNAVTEFTLQASQGCSVLGNAPVQAASSPSKDQDRETHPPGQYGGLRRAACIHHRAERERCGDHAEGVRRRRRLGDQPAAR